MTNAEVLERLEGVADLVKWELRFFGDGPEADVVDIVVSALRLTLENPDASMEDVARTQGTSLGEMRTWWKWNV
ncbi:hypothetical protein ABT354_11090 [Streptomyces sp. NPDC000594]|uniref:hypothetical protein n=1 Tax=Streptomyces sp. NPDC000594 TaxID=3154261 RepID=UPI00332C5C46